jgi:hypothetical protein
LTAYRLFDLHVGEFHKTLNLSFIITLAMVAAVTAIVSMLGSVQPRIRLGIAICSGVATYAGLSMIFNRVQVLEIVAQLKLARRKVGA